MSSSFNSLTYSWYSKFNKYSHFKFERNCYTFLTLVTGQSNLFPNFGSSGAYKTVCISEPIQTVFPLFPPVLLPRVDQGVPYTGVGNKMKINKKRKVGPMILGSLENLFLRST